MIIWFKIITFLLQPVIAGTYWLFWLFIMLLNHLMLITLLSALRFGSKTAEPSSVRSSAASRRSSFRSRRRRQVKAEARRRTRLPPQLSFLTPSSLRHPPPLLLWSQRVLWSVLRRWTWSWTSRQQNTLAVSRRRRTTPQIRRTRVNLRERRWSVREQWHRGMSLRLAKDSALSQVRT